MSGVSPAPGHEPFASANGVTLAKAPSAHRSNTRPTLYAQFRGPFLFNELTDEEKKAEEERKRKEDEEKRTNFDKVRQKAEREEEARKKAEAERDALLAEKKQREEEELKKKQDFEKLAQQKEAEAKQKAEEAEAERKKREEAEKELAEFKKAQEEELNALLNEIPQYKRPPLDDSMTVAQKLKLVRHTQEMLGTAKPPVGHPPSKQGEKTTRKEELLKKGINALTPDEALELAGLTGD